MNFTTSSLNQCFTCMYSKLGIILIQCKTKVIIPNKSVYIAVLRTHFIHASKGIINAILDLSFPLQCGDKKY